jgi:2'-5' RNA ligase
MPYAVEMFFDVPSDSKVCSLWEDFGSIGASHMKDCGARPHITLAVCDSADVSSLSALLDTFARTLHPFPVTLSAVGLFPTAEGVMFLAPKVTAELLSLHRRFFDQFRLQARGVWEHYSPEQWIPHYALAMGLSVGQLAPAFEACRATGLPLVCVVNEIGIVEFRPIKQLYAVPLVAATSSNES